MSKKEIILKDFSELSGQDWVTDLKEGSDFRESILKKEVFMRFYKFHLKYKSHPGGVYYIIPYLSEKYNWGIEEKLWFSYINGVTQNPLTSWVLFKHFPDFGKIDLDEMEKWHRVHWKKLDYDIDRRYLKGHFVEMVENYKENIGNLSQEEYFNNLCSSKNPHENFERVWDTVINNFNRFGRLSTFSYIEYLKIVGLNVECNSLFIYDKSGSKSHRNGLCHVFGREDLDVFKGNENLHPDIKNGHNKEVMEWLEKKGEELLNEVKERFRGEDFYEDVNYFTLESTLCCYKSWHRKNRRYPNVYNDMLHDRIKKAESRIWEDIDGTHIDFNDFWEARKLYLPKELRLEDNPSDPGLHRTKQNWYLETGEVVVMDYFDSVFKNSFLKKNSEIEEWYEGN